MSEAGSVNYENFTPSFPTEFPPFHPDASLPIPEPHSTDEAGVRRDVEERIKAAFGNIQAINSENPNIQELKEYGESLSQKFITLQEPVGISPALADHYYDAIDSKPKQTAFFGEVMERLRNLPQLELLDQYGLIDGLLDGFEKKVGGCRVAFAKNGVFKFGIFTVAFSPKEMEEIVGCYIPIIDVITIPTGKPTDRDIVTSLASRGKLPKSIAGAFHEIRHAKSTQNKGLVKMGEKVQNKIADFGLDIVHFAMRFGTKATYAKLAKIAVDLYSHNQGKQAKSLLREAHSFEETQPVIGYFDSPDTDHPKEGVLQSYENYLLGSMSANKIYDTVSLLKIMGVPEVEIGDLIRRAEYNAQSKTFPAVDERLRSEKNKWGLSDDKDFQLVIDALTAKMDLEKMLLRHEVQKIVTDELQIAAGIQQRIHKQG